MTQDRASGGQLGRSACLELAATCPPRPPPEKLWTSLQLDHSNIPDALRMDIWTTLQVDHMTTPSLAPCVFQFEDTEEKIEGPEHLSAAHTSVDNQRLATP